MTYLPTRETNGRSGLLALLSLAVTSCADEAVDIGDNKRAVTQVAPIYASSAPPGWSDTAGARPPVQKLVDREIGTGMLTVDSGHLYWVANTWNEMGALPPSEKAVQSCAAENCLSTLRVLPLPTTATESGSGAPTIAVNETTVFWDNFESGYRVSFCPRDDCSAFDTLGFGGETYRFHVDATHLFFTRSGLIRCSIADCAGTATHLPVTLPPGERNFAGTSLVALDGEYVYLADGRILRTRKDGSGGAETVVNDVTSVEELVVHNGTVYWAESGPLGRVQACPVTGCDGEPRLVVGGIDQLQHFAVDDQYVYITESLGHDRTPQLPDGSARLSRCAVTGCSKPTALVEDEGLSGIVLVDDVFVYFNGRKCTGEPAIGEACSYIGAIRK